VQDSGTNPSVPIQLPCGITTFAPHIFIALQATGTGIQKPSVHVTAQESESRIYKELKILFWLLDSGS
jgi:hypothetical protein